MSNPIETYLDNIFLGLPKTEEMRDARLRMQESMEEKYDVLRGQGRTEAEALGTVVAEFGSVSELLRELGQSVSSENADAAAPTRPVFPEEEYNQFHKRFGVAIAAGVCLCILGLILATLVGSIQGLDNFVPLFFFAPIACGVFLFIYFGMQEERYEELKKTCGRGKYQGVQYVREPGTPRVIHRAEHPVVSAICSIIMMSATILFLLAGFTRGMWHPAWIVFPVGGILCGMVSIIGGIWQK